jgi:hypothetical protein
MFGMNNNSDRSTIGLRQQTKDRLDRSRAPGQCYDGFICQMIDMWEEIKENT